MIRFNSADTKNEAASKGSAQFHALVPLTNIFDPGCVQSISSCVDRPAVLGQLTHSLAAANRIESSRVEPLLSELLDRERLMTSAMGKGFAFPHVRSRLVDSFVGAVGVAVDGMDLASLDGKSTKIVVLTISPWDQRELHHGLLSRLVSLAQDQTVQLRMDHRFSLADVWQFIQDYDVRTQASV